MHSPDQVCAEIVESVCRALPGAQVRARAASPGHYEIEVVSEAFAGTPRVRQQQLVYAAIAHLMRGPEAPVHAVDRLQTREP